MNYLIEDANDPPTTTATAEKLAQRAAEKYHGKLAHNSVITSLKEIILSELNLTELVESKAALEELKIDNGMHKADTQVLIESILLMRKERDKLRDQLDAELKAGEESAAIYLTLHGEYEGIRAQNEELRKLAHESEWFRDYHEQGCRAIASPGEGYGDCNCNFKALHEAYDAIKHKPWEVDRTAIDAAKGGGANEKLD